MTATTGTSWQLELREYSILQDGRLTLADSALVLNTAQISVGPTHFSERRSRTWTATIFVTVVFYALY